jgi:hypothetical protein
MEIQGLLDLAFCSKTITDFVDVREEGKQLFCPESGWSQTQDLHSNNHKNHLQSLLCPPSL